MFIGKDGLRCTPLFSNVRNSKLVLCIDDIGGAFGKSSCVLLPLCCVPCICRGRVKDDHKQSAELAMKSTFS